MDGTEQKQRLHNAVCYNTYMQRILNQKQPISNYQIETLQTYVKEAILCLKPLVED